MHRIWDTLHPVPIEIDELDDAPLWARKLHHNLEAAAAEQAALKARIEKLERYLAGLAVREEALSSVTAEPMPVPGE